MKRYIVFAGENDVRRGGLNDYFGSYDTMVEGANNIITARENVGWRMDGSIPQWSCGPQWFNVLDTKTGYHYIDECNVVNTSECIMAWAKKCDNISETIDLYHKLVDYKTSTTEDAMEFDNMYYSLLKHCLDTYEVTSQTTRERVGKVFAQHPYDRPRDSYYNSYIPNMPPLMPPLTEKVLMTVPEDIIPFFVCRYVKSKYCISPFVQNETKYRFNELCHFVLKNSN